LSPDKGRGKKVRGAKVFTPRMPSTPAGGRGPKFDADRGGGGGKKIYLQEKVRQLVYHVGEKTRRNAYQREGGEEEKALGGAREGPHFAAA